MGLADILKRRLLRSVLTYWNVASFREFQDLATIDVLRDVKYPSCAYLVRLLRVGLRANAYLNYVVAREYFYIRRGLRVVGSIILGNAKASSRGTGKVQVSRFYLCPLFD